MRSIDSRSRLAPRSAAASWVSGLPSASGSHPDSAGLRVSIPNPQPRNWNKDGYLKKLPVDPWGNPYQYLAPGTKGPFDLYSLGADGKEGGSDNDADIGNWDI